MGAALFPGIGCCEQTPTSTVATPKGWYVVENRAEGRAIPASSANVFMALQGLVDANDGLGGIYTWYSASTDADDGQTVLEPDDSTGAGRWLKLI